MSNINVHSSKQKQFKILLIDDEESCLTGLEVALFNTIYEVVKTSSGREGLEYVENHPGEVDIILLDLMMPDFNGIEVIKEFNKVSCKIPIIIQTASYNYSDISKALKLGAKNFLSKPFDKKTVDVSAQQNSIKRKFNCRKRQPRRESINICLNDFDYYIHNTDK